MRDRLDEEKLEILRGWGSGLTEDERDEIRAAGKAILILIEEIERLQVELWHTRSDLAVHAAEAHEPGTAEPAEPAEPAQALGSVLKARLAGRWPVEPATPRTDF